MSLGSAEVPVSCCGPLGTACLTGSTRRATVQGVRGGCGAATWAQLLTGFARTASRRVIFTFAASYHGCRVTPTRL